MESNEIKEQSEAYDHRVAYTETIKVVNNRQSTPVTLKFAAITKNSQYFQKHVIIFATIKLIIPSTVIISLTDVIYNHLKDFPCSHVYRNTFDVNLDKNSHLKPHIYVKRTIESTLTINNIKYGQRNIMITLEQQQVFLQFNKLFTHREACIGWLKYSSTSLTLQSPTKFRVENILKVAYFTPVEIK